MNTSKFKVGQVVFDLLLNQGTSVLAVSFTTVLGKMIPIYKCYVSDPVNGSYRAEDELKAVKGGKPYEAEC